MATRGQLGRNLPLPWSTVFLAHAASSQLPTLEWPARLYEVDNI